MYPSFFNDNFLKFEIIGLQLIIQKILEYIALIYQPKNKINFWMCLAN